MEVSEDGFLLPRTSQPLADEEASSFASFCPGLGYPAPTHETAATRSDVFGHVEDSYTAWAQDPNLRFAGASGGALTALAQCALEKGLVDAVVSVSGDEGGEPWSRSLCLKSEDSVYSIAGSRYAPVAPFAALLSLPRESRVLVIGKPCDIAALRRLEANGAAGLPDVLYFLSFFCAGVPSLKGTSSLLTQLGINSDEVQRIAYRGKGWPGHFEVETTDGRLGHMTYEQSWGTTLNKFLNVRCKLCQDGVGRYADIVAADYWSVDSRGYPTFVDQDGVSLLVARTQVGQLLIQEAVGQFLDVKPVPMANVYERQPSQVRRFRYSGIRRLGYKLAGSLVPQIVTRNAVKALCEAPFEAMRQFVGAYRRGRRQSMSPNSGSGT